MADDRRRRVRRRGAAGLHSPDGRGRDRGVHGVQGDHRRAEVVDRREGSLMPLPTPLPSEYTKPATFGGVDQEEPKPPKQKPYTPPKRSDYDRIKAKPESEWTEAEKKYMAGQQAINLGREAEGVAKSKIGLYDPYIVDLLGDVQEEGARMKKLPGEFQRAGSQALAGAKGQAGLGGAAMTPGAALAGSQVAGDMQTRASEAERAAAAQIR